MSSWTKEEVLNLIEIYRKYECFWKVTCKEYSNKALKEQAYTKLTQYVKTFDPQASKDTVTKKIANLRTAFGKEYKKVESSKVSGAGAQDIILPKLWYYEDLMFLKDQNTVRKARSNVEEDTTPPLLDGFDTEYETEEVRYNHVYDYVYFIKITAFFFFHVSTSNYPCLRSHFPSLPFFLPLSHSCLRLYLSLSIHPSIDPSIHPYVLSKLLSPCYFNIILSCHGTLPSLLKQCV